MEPEINASEYPEPAQLAHEIRSKVGQLYVDCVWVKFAHRKAMVRPCEADQICKGLMMADQLILDQIEADGGDQRTPSYGVSAGS
jgi:hypothetical protein